ncbi:coiled-coil domain-containing protein 97 [Drosophila tropicalis]|uniref:coiled-coil domain-containing protein 97 n=1 Tax=Drosophila tropicalis TaxID=46794 RepID=UPI0035AC018F
MTTGDDAEALSPQPAESTGLPTQLLDIFKSLAANCQITFKSQQIDDPELQSEEKQEIAKEVFCKNRENFLIRFGRYMTAPQLNDFQSLGIGEPFKIDESLDEMCLLLDDFQRKLTTRSVCVKNRRYHAMQDLIQKGEYFSEHEMMQRAPDLYQELVGQYMTEEEKKARDTYDVRNTTFSGILMHTLEQKQREELLEGRENESLEIKEKVEEVEDEVPVNCRSQWGGFDDDEPVACSTSTIKHLPKISTPEYYNPAERELLRNEFMSLMQERFLSGEDSDFDYTAVDDNAIFDDLKQIEQDEEDAYFDEDEDPVEQVEMASEQNAGDVSSSEDELDIYMRHLQQHPSLQHS